MHACKSSSHFKNCLDVKETLYFLRWNNLKMKVAQAKQRLGPRIQSEEKSVTAVSIIWHLYV